MNIIRDHGIEKEEFMIEDEELLADLKASLAEADRGETIPWEQVRAELFGDD